MKLVSALALAAALIAVTGTESSAQALNLSGQFRCVQGCAAGLVGGPAFVVQTGWDMRLTNEAGAPSRAWIDYPGHIWAQNWNEGAVYSPDGMTIQFDRGTVWQRDLGGVAPPPPAPVTEVPPSGARPMRTARVAPGPAERVPAAVNAFDGNWSVVILTRSGGCDPSYRFGFRIYNGYIYADVGESANLQGHVAPNGAVRVSVSSGGQSASGQGRLSRASGSGAWSGQGSSGSCGGVWQAARRD
jgi:hypothetical protein